MIGHVLGSGQTLISFLLGGLFVRAASAAKALRTAIAGPCPAAPSAPRDGTAPADAGCTSDPASSNFACAI